MKLSHRYVFEPASKRPRQDQNSALNIVGFSEPAVPTFAALAPSRILLRKNARLYCAAQS
jgi:hypothetical protein